MSDAHLTPRWLTGACLAALCAAAPLHAVEPTEFNCMIQPAEVVELSSAASGVLAEIGVDRGDRVQAGQVLARLESSVEEATYAEAKARAAMSGEVETRKAELDFTERRLKRFEELYRNKVVSVQERDEAQTQVLLARLALEQARAAQRLAVLQEARAAALLERFTLRSPIDGVVAERYLAAGEYVKERPILKLIQINPLRIEALLPVQYFGQVQAGSQATVVARLPGAPRLSAEIVRIDPVVDAASATFGVRLQVANPDDRIPAGVDCRLHLNGLVAAPESR
ncbi:MAG: efflux RND transporter periplasmic adaptor subunit [Gammaproteobacteria bacterium]